MLTIVLWCVESTEAVKGVLGDMGVVAIIPIVAFYGSGVLRKVGISFLCFWGGGRVRID